MRPVVLQEHGGDGEGSFEVAVAAFDGFLAFVAAEHLGGGGDARVEVGQEGVPAVGGCFGGDRVVLEVPGEGGFAGGGVGADGGA